MAGQSHLHIVAFRPVLRQYYVSLPAPESTADPEEPLDITSLPVGLDSDDHDGIDQAQILASIFDSSYIPPSEREDYLLQPIKDVRLSSLREDYEQKKVLRAMAKLRNRCRIIIDDDYCINSTDDLLYWSANVHHLDFVVVVADSIGLWTILPNVTADHTFLFNLDVKKQLKLFNAKYCRLGFDPTGRFCFIGRRNAIDHWIAFCPNDVIAGVSEDEIKNYPKCDTRLKTSHYRMLVVFLALCISQNPNRWITMVEPYSINVHSGDANWKSQTNIL